MNVVYVDAYVAPLADHHASRVSWRDVHVTDDVVISALGEDVVASETSRYAGLTGELTTTELTEEIDGGIAEVVTHLASASGAPVLKRTEATTTLTSSLGSETTVEVTTSGVGTTPHGDVSYLTSEDRTEITGQRSYDPWGVPRARVGETGPLGYQGDPTDDITGLVDMGARSYDPSLGRFLSKDPLIGSPENPISLNPYVYGWDDPMSMTDPEGLAPVYCPSGQRCGQAVEGSREQRNALASNPAAISPTYFDDPSSTTRPRIITFVDEITRHLPGLVGLGISHWRHIGIVQTPTLILQLEAGGRATTGGLVDVVLSGPSTVSVRFKEAEVTDVGAIRNLVFGKNLGEALGAGWGSSFAQFAFRLDSSELALGKGVGATYGRVNALLEYDASSMSVTYSVAGIETEDATISFAVRARYMPRPLGWSPEPVILAVGSAAAARVLVSAARSALGNVGFFPGKITPTGAR